MGKRVNYVEKRDEKSKNVVNVFREEISYKKEIEELYKKENIAKMLLKEEITSEDLTDEEVEDMIEYFIKDTEKKKKELERIGMRILKIRKL